MRDFSNKSRIWVLIKHLANMQHLINKQVALLVSLALLCQVQLQSAIYFLNKIKEIESQD
jgi:hypothetical protein